MPNRAPRLCNHPACGKLAIASYCERHQRERLARGYAQGKTHERGYGAPWRRLRAQILQRDDHLCQACREAGRLTPASEVDHIVPKARGGTDDPSNLRAICTPCHRAKTARE